MQIDYRLPSVRYVLATDYGWKRRPDLGGHAWEMPDGRFYDHHDDGIPELMVCDWPPSP